MNRIILSKEYLAQFDPNSTEDLIRLEKAIKSRMKVYGFLENSPTNAYVKLDTGEMVIEQTFN